MDLTSQTDDFMIAEHVLDFVLLKEAVREAGDIARSFFGKNIAVGRKPDNSEVTEADRTVDAFLKNTLTTARPGYGWLSEESEDDAARLSASRVWIVDPIDGTRAFIQNKPEWAVSAALVEDGTPILAAIYNPVSGEFFSARRGAGAELNGTPVFVSQRTELEGSRILGSKGVLKHLHWTSTQPGIKFKWVYSIAYRLALVACGAADATIALSPKSEWDVAAAVLLVCEAGGRVTAPRGTGLTFNKRVPRCEGVIAAGEHLHGLLVKRITRAAKQSATV